MQLHALEPLFKLFYTISFVGKNFSSCRHKSSREKLQTNIWKIQSKRLEKFKHSYSRQNLLVKSFAV